MSGSIIYAVWQQGSKCEFCKADEIYLLNFKVSVDINQENQEINPTPTPYYVCNSCKKIANSEEKYQRYDHITIKHCTHESRHTTYIGEDQIIEMCIRCGKVIR